MNKTDRSLLRLTFAALVGLIIVLAICWQPAQAEPLCDRVIFGGWSYHADREYDYNETHDMIGIQCHGVSAMRFTNSYGDEAYGIGYDWVGYRKGPVELGAYAGVWTGYDDYDYGMPVGGVRARVNVGPAALVVTTAVEVSTLHLEWRF